MADSMAGAGEHKMILNHLTELESKKILRENRI